MSITVRALQNARYAGVATPPHVHEAWSSNSPLTARELIEELRARGCHQQDVDDAFYAADPGWLERLSRDGISG
jgi:hypothetical protein